MAKKAFKRLRIARPSLDLEPRSAVGCAASWQPKINHPLSIRAAREARARSTRKAAANRRLAFARALDGAAFTVQRFRRIT
jgi:hypothetical protein